MKKTNNTNITPITFTQAKTLVTADRYVPYALYTQNTDFYTSLQGSHLPICFVLTLMFAAA